MAVSYFDTLTGIRPPLSWTSLGGGLTSLLFDVGVPAPRSESTQIDSNAASGLSTPGRRIRGRVSSLCPPSPDRASAFTESHPARAEGIHCGLEWPKGTAPGAVEVSSFLPSSFAAWLTPLVSQIVSPVVHRRVDGK
jgi:hypothetical protein